MLDGRGVWDSAGLQGLGRPVAWCLGVMRGGGSCSLILGRSKGGSYRGGSRSQGSRRQSPKVPVYFPAALPPDASAVPER